MEISASLSYFLLLLVHCFLAAGLAVTEGANITTDQSALLALKAHITDDPLQILTSNWSATAATISVCNWVGITCDGNHHRVTGLNLSHMGLTGTIPPHVGNLSFLSHLAFRDNLFHGSLPSELAFLRRLKVVSFGQNNLDGEIPSWFGSFPKLEELYLCCNRFSGTIPASLCNTSSLQIINLSENMLSGWIPTTLRNCTSLKEIYLNQNNLTEYGSQGIISTSGDVYSYGILLMETFTRKKPTDEMFSGEMSLKRWIKESLPHAVTKVVDANLLQKDNTHFGAKQDCISSIMQLAMDCSAEAPEERIKMGDVITTLKAIKMKFLKDAGGMAT